MNTSPLLEQPHGVLGRRAWPRRGWLAALALLTALLAFTPAGAVSAAPQLQDPTCSGGIAGQIVDADGAAIEGVRVLALPVVSGSRPVDPNGEPPQTTTDAEGNYAFESLCAGGYVVIAFLEDPNRPLRGIYDADGDGEPDILELAEDDTRLEDIDLVLGATIAAPDPGRPSPGPAPRQCAIDDGVITGIVTNADGETVAGAEVVARGANAPTASGVGRVAEAATTDEEGRYRIEGLCEGGYVVTASWLSAGAIQVGIYDADGDGARDLVVLGEDKRVAEEIDIVLLGRTQPPGQPDPRPNPPVTPRECTIDDGAISGLVSNVDGDAVEGARVLAFPVNASGTPTPNLAGAGRAMTDADGRYVIEGLCEGRYFVVAQLRSTMGALQGVYDMDGDGRPDGVGLSEDDRAAEDIDIVLEQMVSSPGAPGRPAPDPRPEPPRAPRCAIDDGTIRGTITDPNGAVVEGAQVLAVPAGAQSALGAVVTPVLPVRSDADGNYEVTGLCEGDYQVLAFLPGSSGMHMGFYDADDDGAPDKVSLAPDARTAEAVDIQLVSLTDIGLPGSGGTMPLPKPAPLPMPPASGW